MVAARAYEEHSDGQPVEISFELPWNSLSVCNHMGLLCERDLLVSFLETCDAAQARRRYPLLNIQRTSSKQAPRKSRIIPTLRVTLTSANP